MNKSRYSNLQTYDNYKRNKRITIIAVVLIALLVVGLILYSIYSNKTKYSSISSIEFSTSTGPVAPEFQSTKTLTLQNNGCSIVVSGSVNQNGSQPCSLTKSGYQNIVDSYYKNDVQGSINANNSAGQPELLGGQTRTITIKKSDGSVLQTKVTVELIKNIQPFLETVSQNVAQYSSIGF